MASGMANPYNLYRLSWRAKVPITIGSVICSFYIARWCFYRPVIKKHPEDMAVPVERSGGGI